MAKNESVTVTVLKQIRDEVVGVRTDVRDTREVLSARIDQTNERIEQTNERIQQTNERLEATNDGLEKLGGKVDALTRRQTESEVRLATELVAVSQAVHGVRDLLRERLDDRQRVDDHERRLAALERRSA